MWNKKGTLSEAHWSLFGVWYECTAEENDREIGAGIIPYSSNLLSTSILIIKKRMNEAEGESLSRGGVGV